MRTQRERIRRGGQKTANRTAILCDPGMCFELYKPRLCSPELAPYYWRNDYAGGEQYSRYTDGTNCVFVPSLPQQHREFVRLWNMNLRAQAF